MDAADVYEVFARKAHDEPLQHVGSVNAADDDLARAYAWTLYDEERWIEMCVVRRGAIVPVTPGRRVPLWGN
jgi:1,2-phenylacetyl-CoA epoxidase PaaB subunit